MVKKGRAARAARLARAGRAGRAGGRRRSSGRSQAQQAKLDCERTEQMFKKGAISQGRLRPRRTPSARRRSGTVAAAEAHKTQIAEALRDTEIRAPFSGMIVERAVTAGEYVRRRVAGGDAGRRSTTLRVELTVPEADVARCGQGMSRRRSAPPATPARPAIDGKIRYVGPSVRRADARRDRRGGGRRIAATTCGRACSSPRSWRWASSRCRSVPATAVRADGNAAPRLRRAAAAVWRIGWCRRREPQDGQVPILSGLKAGRAGRRRAAPPTCATARR